MFGGQVGIAGHIHIGNKVKLGAQSGVPSSIKDGSQLIGTPPMEPVSYTHLDVYKRQVVLCGGYYMLGHALKPEDLITRSRNIAESYNFMFEQYPCLLYTSDTARRDSAYIHLCCLRHGHLYAERHPLGRAEQGK